MTVIPPEVRRAQGRRTGALSRALAIAVDLLIAVVLYLLALAIYNGAEGIISQSFEFTVPDRPWGGILYFVVVAGYLTYGWGLNGRTLGLMALGLRVVRSDGTDLSFQRAVARVALYIVFPPGILWCLVSRKNASLQDLVLRTAVIYDWGLEAARVRVRVRRPDGTVAAAPSAD